MIWICKNYSLLLINSWWDGSKNYSLQWSSIEEKLLDQFLKKHLQDFEKNPVQCSPFLHWIDKKRLEKLFWRVSYLKNMKLTKKARKVRISIASIFKGIPSGKSSYLAIRIRDSTCISAEKESRGWIELDWSWDIKVDSGRIVISGKS